MEDIRAVKVPTKDEFLAYDGAHCFRLWEKVGAFWRCPSCRRNKFQILRWAARRHQKTNAKFFGWMAGLHRHHDHSAELSGSGSTRFSSVVICDQCNGADGAAKKKLGLPPDFSFSPEEIGGFVIARAHEKHELIYGAAKEIYARAQR